MPLPENEFDPLAELHARVRGALVGRRRREALEALKQILALEPYDEDASENLRDLLFSVNRDLEDFERKHGSLAEITTEEARQERMALLDQELPYWRGFVEDVGSLRHLSEPIASNDDHSVEEDLLAMIHAGRVAEALAAWKSRGRSVGLSPQLAILLGKVDKIQTADRQGNIAVWQSAFSDFASVGSTPELESLLRPFNGYLEASRWRLKSISRIKRVKELAGKEGAREAAKQIEQLNMMEEELRARPELCGTHADLPANVAEAISAMRELGASKAASGMVIPSIFGFLLLSLLGGYVWYRGQESLGPVVGISDPAPSAPRPAQFQPWKPAATPKAINPKPLEGDVIMLMPDRWSMVFRKVYLPSRQQPPGNARFKSHTEEMEDIWAPFSDSEGRYYLMGKYEVTWGQLSRFVDVPKAGGAELPASDVTAQQAVDFCSRYSQWLGTQGGSLKSPSGRPARVRIPTAAEWEFAACGGVLTFGKNSFGKPLPWAGPPTPYEWHAGATSSGGAIHPIGLLKPHPLGMFDVVGNVCEMARAEGAETPVWMMGGDVTVSESQMTVFRKQKLPLLKPEANVPFSQLQLGVRVLMTTEQDVFEKPSS